MSTDRVVIKKIPGGFEINGVRIAELSPQQLAAVAASGDPRAEAMTSAGVQSAFAEALWSRRIRKHGKVVVLVDE
jgi:hypothetical protein